jgi:hypothetical protein
MGTRDLIVATCAVVGAGLGVLNLIRSYLADSERVRVAVYSGGQDGYPRIEVVNVSPFPITVTEIRRFVSPGQTPMAGIERENPDNKKMPCRIEARHAQAFTVSMRETIAEQVYKPKYTFARTALGNVFTSEPSLARWWRQARELLHLKPRDL